MPQRQFFLVWSSDRTGGSTTDYTVKLSPAITNIVNVDWVSCSVPGLVLQIEEFTTLSRTSNGFYYWRFVGDLTRTMTRYEEPMRAITLNQFTVHWRNPDGSVPVSLPEHSLELELWCEPEED